MNEHLKVLAAIATGKVAHVDGDEARILKEWILLGNAKAVFSGADDDLNGLSYINPEVTIQGQNYLESHYAFA